MVKFFVLVGYLCISTLAAAQVSPSNPGGFNNTDPRSPAYNPGLALPPRSETSQQWLDRWGAIATDGRGEYGIVMDRDTERAAIVEAIAACQERGGSGCKLKRAFMNQCAAVVYGATATQTAQAAYEDRAIALATADCDKHAGGSCRVYYSGCSLPVKASD